MTPEQEDAHWALMGLPLMRAWRERCRLRAEADEKMAEAGRQFGDGNEQLYNHLMGAAQKLRHDAGTLWYAAIADAYGKGVAVRWDFGSCTVANGETYTVELCAATTDDAEGL